MQCMKCNRDIFECDCPDLLERLERANDSPFVDIFNTICEVERKRAARRPEEPRDGEHDA